MDILYLLDRLEDVLTSSTKLPIINRTLVDEQECLDIIDQIRVAIPEEVRQARQLNAMREDVLANARRLAERTIQEAQERAALMVKEQALVRSAESLAAEVRAAAYREADEIRRGADEYAYRVLAALEAQLDQVMRSIRKGIEHLDRMRTEEEESVR